MTIDYDKPTRTMTVVFTAAEDRALTRITKSVGQDAVKHTLETWMIQQIRALADRDLVSIKERLQNANAAELESVKTALNIT